MICPFLALRSRDSTLDPGKHTVTSSLSLTCLLSSYDADYLLTKFSDFLCPAHVPDGQACATPLNPGTYGGDPPIEVVIPEIPDLIAGFLASGTYYADATISYADGTMMTCLYVRIEVVG